MPYLQNSRELWLYTIHISYYIWCGLEVSSITVWIGYLMLDIYSQPRSKISHILRELSLPEVHSKSVFRSLYRQKTANLSQVENLPKKLVSHLNSHYSFSMGYISKETQSKYDDSVKFVITLCDGKQIETVLMPEKSRITLCLSTQVGCQQGCTFCYTGRMGLIRHLTVGEIVSQVYLANSWIDQNLDWLERQGLPRRQRVSNIVFMGMGEPLDNVSNVCDAILILQDRFGLGIGPRKITVSTAGHVDGLKILGQRLPNVCLAVSLHSPTNTTRSKIMPINRRWPLEVLVEQLKVFQESNRRHIFIQYTIIHKVNDSADQAHKLAKLLEGLKVKINIIPLNPIDPTRFQSPEHEQIQMFRDVLHEYGYRVLIRYSKGQDIGAACGQLVQV